MSVTALHGSETQTDDPNSYGAKRLETWSVASGWNLETVHISKGSSMYQYKIGEDSATKIGNDKLQLRQSPRYSSESLTAN